MPPSTYPPSISVITFVYLMLCEILLTLPSQNEKKKKTVLRDFLCPSNNLISNWQNATNRKSNQKATDQKI